VRDGWLAVYARAQLVLSLQNVHQLTQPIINNLLAVFQCIHVYEWSLLNEFLNGFDFVFEFPDLDPQVISDLAVIEDYGLFFLLFVNALSP
jgi:hypothetical protein